MSESSPGPEKPTARPSARVWFSILCGLLVAAGAIGRIDRVFLKPQRDQDALQKSYDDFLARHPDLDPKQKQKEWDEFRRPALPAEALARSFLERIRSDNRDAAYAMLSAKLRESLSRDQFERAILSHPWIQTKNAGNVICDSNVGPLISTSLETGPAGAAAIGVARGRREGEFEIDSFTINKTEKP